MSFLYVLLKLKIIILALTTKLCGTSYQPKHCKSVSLSRCSDVSVWDTTSWSKKQLQQLSVSNFGSYLVLYITPHVSGWFIPQKIGIPPRSRSSKTIARKHVERAIVLNIGNSIPSVKKNSNLYKLRKICSKKYLTSEMCGKKASPSR